MSGLVRAEPLFRARRRAQRRRAARSGIAAATATTIVGGAAWVALYSPVLRATGVTVEGMSRLQSAQVFAVARVPLGGSLLRVPTAQVQARVAAVPFVANVQVHRAWPHRITIEVRERVPVAAVATATGQVLVDRTGMPFGTDATVPGLLDLRVPDVVVGHRDQVARAALDVWAALPAGVRAQVRWVAGQSTYDVSFGLASGSTVRWGSADDTAEKLAVLAALMRHHASVYDVSTPDVPVTR
jgi:cell division protein FtsQ